MGLEDKRYCSIHRITFHVYVERRLGEWRSINNCPACLLEQKHKKSLKRQRVRKRAEGK